MPKRKLTEQMEQTAAEAMELLDFLYDGKATEQDQMNIRAMVVRGATAEQISFSIATAATNNRVSMEDKTRYAFGVLRNVMMEDSDG